jgi:hypothetical protein
MSGLRQNPMLKLIEYVDQYEKNTDMDTVGKFYVFNVIFVILSVIGIMANILLIAILYRSYKYSKKNYLYKLIHKHYSAKWLLIVILICNCMYLLNNFIIMSQFGLASKALGGLNNYNVACKLAFTLFPPTTAYTLMKQLSIWLLIYIIREHHLKIRTIKLLDNFYMINNYTNTILTVNKSNSKNNKAASRRNLYAFLFIFTVIFLYNAPNLFLYSLASLKNPITNTTFDYCAYTQDYAERTFVLTQSYLYPYGNLIFFVFVPFVVGLVYILFDLCYLIRMYKEEQKRYEYLKMFVEYPIYLYFCVYFFCDMFYAFHQLHDIASGKLLLFDPLA